MARLPQPGGDSGNWGDILNDFLSQAHNNDGTIKAGAVSSSDVGLGNVDNTADTDKPVSSAAQSALDAKISGPGSATDNTIMRWDGTTGRLAQNSSAYIDDSGQLGVGIASPTSKLHVVATTTGGQATRIQNTQSIPNTSDTADSTLRLEYYLSASSTNNQLVSRVFQLTANNQLTGGGQLTNLRVLNISTFSNAGTVADTSSGVFIETGTNSGTINKSYGLNVQSLAGTSQIGVGVSNLSTGTNNTLMLLGTSTPVTGNFAIYSANAYNSYFAGLLGFGTSAPTSTLTLSSTSSGYAHYNTSDQTTNYERVRQYWGGNSFIIESTAAGTGTARSLQLNGASTSLTLGAGIGPAGNAAVSIRRDTTTMAMLFEVYSSSMQAGSGNQAGLVVDPVINQSGSAGYTGIKVNPTESATGSGTKLLADFQVGGSSKVNIDNTGKTFIAKKSATSTDSSMVIGEDIAPSTGTSQAKLVLGATTNESNLLLGQDSTHSLLFGWKYNATATSAYGLLETYANNNPLVLQSGTGKIGIGTTAPTHTLTLSSTGTGFAVYNTTDQTTNYERLRVFWTSNLLTINTEAGGTGTIRSMRIGTSGAPLIFADAVSVNGFYQFNRGSSGAGSQMVLNPGFSGASVAQNTLVINPTYTQTGTASATDLTINRVQTSVGSGAQLFVDFQASGASKFNVQNDGRVFMANVVAAPATPTGGGVIYVEAGALKYKGSSGTITVLGNA